MTIYLTNWDDVSLPQGENGCANVHYNYWSYETLLGQLFSDFIVMVGIELGLQLSVLFHAYHARKSRPK